ncbi:MAG: hypothetical protein O7B99_02470 [Planctomycetota bacterium]|nr:hypothetical protein [Planctomycetota bacterium]
MTRPLLLVTGFGPFVGVDHNPSGEVARALEAEPPAVAEVRAAVLPVSFERVPAAYDALLADLAPRRPAALVALGVQLHAYFRLERRARARLRSAKADNDGREGTGIVLAGGDMETGLDLEPLAAALTRAGGTEVRISEDAGGFVCEGTYHHVLKRAGELGVPGLFLHVPPVDVVAVAAQVPVVRGLLEELVKQLDPSRV